MGSQASAGLIVGAFFIGIAAILVLITLHEFGHFLIAKLCNAYVYEFSIGYGPRIYTHKGKETWFSIRLFPLGGFCSIASDRSDAPKGREEEAEQVPDNRKMDYIARWKKAMFILGGPVMNFAIAIIMISIIFMACLKMPQDMSFNGNMFNKDKVAYKLIDKSFDKYKELKDFKPEFDKNSQYISITGWEVIQAKDWSDSYNGKTAKDFWGNDGKGNVQGVKLIYSNLIEDGSTKAWISDNSFKSFNDYIQDNFKKNWKDISKLWIVDPNASSTDLKAPDYSTIVYNFLDNYKSNKMVETNGYHSYIRFSYRIMDKNLYTGNYQSTKDYVTDFSAKDKFKLNKGNTTQVGVNPPARYFKNTTKAYAYSWHVMGQDSLSILKAFALLFTGHINALAGPVGVASQTATLIRAPETFFLYMAGLSANLFVLNLIPVPPLDGYKFCENIIEACMRKELKQKAKYWLYGIGVAVFVIIFVVVTIKDFVIG